MPIDSSIYSKFQPVDIGGSVERGLRLGDMINQQRIQQDALVKQKAIDQAYQQGIYKKEDGTVGYDGNKTLSALTQIPDAGKEVVSAIDQNRQRTIADAEALKKKHTADLEEVGRRLRGINKDNYLTVIGKMKTDGYDVSDFPANYDQKVVDDHIMQGLSLEKQMEEKWKKANFDQKERELGIKHDENNIKRQQMMNDKNEKRITALKDDLDPNKARGGNLAKSQSMLNSAERVNGLFQQFPDGNIPKGQTNELAAAVAGLINGGSAQSQHQIDSLTPSSMRGDAQAIASWLTNQPLGQEQQAFMKQMKETVDREGEIATDQVRRAQIQRLAAHKNLEKADPQTYRAVLQSYGITPDMIDEKGQYKKAEKKTAAPSAPPHPADDAMLKWAQENPKAPGAADVLKANGL